jgi:alpha-glucosidase
MYFYKIAHPANFVFADEADPASRRLRMHDGDAQLTVRSVGADIHQVVVEHPRWPTNPSQAELEPSVAGETHHSVSLDTTGALTVTEQVSGAAVLRGVPHATFGVCGDNWMFQFRHEPDMQFYGLGEHCRHLEKSGQRVKFWNTDVFGDFAHCEVYAGYPNPMYVAIPWVIVKQGN